MKLTKTAKIGNKNIIKTTSKVVPESEPVTEPGTELEFDKMVELEFNTSVELFNVRVEFKSNGMLYYKCCNYKKSTNKSIESYSCEIRRAVFHEHY